MENIEASKLAEYCEMLSNITNQPDNKKCFDCTDTTSPRFLCTNFSTFICSCCATIHQELGHKIKVLSIFSFDVNEVYVLRGTGNKVAADKWLARWTPERCTEPDPTSPTYKEDARKYLRLKYVEKKWVKLPPPLPLGEKRKASQGADSAGEISPASSTDNSPRWYSDSSAESSPRDAEVPVGYIRASVLQQQHDSEKASTNPFLSDMPHTPPAVIYVPQHMVVPFTFPPGQYGFPQYPMVVDVSQLPQYYPPNVSPRNQQSFNPFESAPAALQEYGRSPERACCPQYHSYKDMPRFSLDEAQPKQPVLRSISDNSLNANIRPELLEEAKKASASQLNISKTESPTKTENGKTTGKAESPTKTESSKAEQPLISKADGKADQSVLSKAEQHKQKLQGMVNRMTGLLKKSTTST